LVVNFLRCTFCRVLLRHLIGSPQGYYFAPRYFTNPLIITSHYDSHRSTNQDESTRYTFYKIVLGYHLELLNPSILNPDQLTNLNTITNSDLIIDFDYLSTHYSKVFLISTNIAIIVDSPSRLSTYSLTSRFNFKFV